MFANLYIYFICLKLFVKKNTNKFKQAIGFQYILLFVTKGSDRDQFAEPASQMSIRLRTRRLHNSVWITPQITQKKYYFIHFKGVFPEKMYFTAKLPNNAPKLFAKTSSKSGSLSLVATPCNTSIIIP